MFMHNEAEQKIKIKYSSIEHILHTFFKFYTFIIVIYKSIIYRKVFLIFIIVTTISLKPKHIIKALR